MKVGVFGAGGRMGSTVCQAVLDDPELELVGAVDPTYAGQTLKDATGLDSSVVISGDLSAFSDAGAEVVVDFTHREASVPALMWLAEHGIHAVVGTTGYSDDELEQFRGAFTQSRCIIAPNFAIGAVLMMKFAAAAAPFFETAEVIELHHDNKIDAPSGTATRTVELMEDASTQWADDPTKHEVMQGARGGVSDSGIHVHSVRLRGLVAHQEVLLGTTGQTLTIRHDSIDRTSFMPGVILAVKRAGESTGVTLGLESLLDL